jgi:hypothetical protein
LDGEWRVPGNICGDGEMHTLKSVARRPSRTQSRTSAARDSQGVICWQRMIAEGDRRRRRSARGLACSRIATRVRPEGRICLSGHGARIVCMYGEIAWPASRLERKQDGSWDGARQRGWREGRLARGPDEVEDLEEGREGSRGIGDARPSQPPETWTELAVESSR